MALKGDLASVDLAQVFQMLALNQKVGMLYIQSPTTWKALYFEVQGACLFFNEHVLLDKVLQQVTRTGRVAADVAQRVRNQSAERGLGLADALIQEGHLTESDLASAVRAEMEEEIYDLFFWTDAHFEFFEGATTVEGRDGQVDPRFRFSTDSLIMEAARRIDEWSFIRERVATPQEIFTPIASSANVTELDDSALALLELVDGKRNVARLEEITGLSEFLVYKGLAIILDEGLIDHVQPNELMLTAQECEQEGRLLDAINLYEKAVTLGEGLPLSHERAAGAYAKVREHELSAYHYKCVAEARAASGDTRQAVDLLLSVIELIPTDLGARELLVELTVGHQELATREFDPVRHAKDLVDLYIAIGEVDRVRNILERLLRDNPFDVELKKSLVNVHSKAGDTKRVMELHESIAEDYVENKQPIEAVKYLQKILMLDRGRRDISERIRSLYVLDERRRSRRRGIAAAVIVVSTAIALSALYFGYDRYARSQLNAVDATVDELIAEKRYVEAAQLYHGFGEQFPLTTLSDSVDQKLVRVLGLKRREEEVIDRIRQVELRTNEKFRQAYRVGYERYEDLVDQNRLERALEQLSAVEGLVARAGEFDDQAWADENHLAEEIASLRGHIADSSGMHAAAGQAFQAGDWREARELWINLLDSFPMSKEARNARLPVYVETFPAGARVYVDGEVQQGVGLSGVSEPLTTPCLVMCGIDKPQKFELRRAGFRATTKSVRAISEESVSVRMNAIPSELLEFAEPVSGGLTVYRNTLAAGLRGGAIALVRVGASRAEATIQLPELDELDGAVQVTPSSVVFNTANGHLMSYSLQTGERLWKVVLSDRPQFGVQVHKDRAFVIDDADRLVGFDVSSGRRDLSVMLPDSPLGAPVFYANTVMVPLKSGQLARVDITTRSVNPERIALAEDVITGIHSFGRLVLFGTSTGDVVAVNTDTGKRQWQVPVADENVEAVTRLAVSSDRQCVIAIDAAGQIARIQLDSGALQARSKIEGTLLSGPIVSGERVFYTERRTLPTGAQDVLVSLQLAALQLDWEYRESGRFAADVVATDRDVFLPNSSGKVVRF